MGQFENYHADNATHKLKCCHAYNGRSKHFYEMPCCVLKDMGDGRLKVLVFGERFFSDRQHIKKIRYVDKLRLIPTPQDTEAGDE